MINIHDKLYIIKGYNRSVEDCDSLLAYMTYADYLKGTDTPTTAFEKRMDTGYNWGKPRRTYNYEKGGYDPLQDYDKNKYEIYCDNTPVTNVKIVGSVSRWSTSNKLIQVEDPRGFVVEIPTGNLTTLLKHTTVEKGVVQEPCVWGREGNNHILLPTNSDVYKLARQHTDLTNERVSLSKLEVGDKVKFSADSDEEYVYLGRAKGVWTYTVKQAKGELERCGWRHEMKYTKRSSDEVLHTEDVKDSKLCFMFECLNKDVDRSWKYEYKLSGKAIVLSKGEKVVRPEKVELTRPERAKPSFVVWDFYQCSWQGSFYGYEGKYLDITTKEIIWKE